MFWTKEQGLFEVYYCATTHKAQRSIYIKIIKLLEQPKLLNQKLKKILIMQLYFQMQYIFITIAMLQILRLKKNNGKYNSFK